MPPGCGGAGEEEEKKKKTEEDELCECVFQAAAPEIKKKRREKYIFKTVNDRLQLCCGRPAEPAA